MVELDRIKELSKEKHRSFTYLSKQLGQNDGYLKDKKLHNSPLSSEQLSIIADILDTTTDYLQGKTDKKEKPDVNVELSEQEKHFISVIRTLSPEDVSHLEAIADSLRRLK